MRCVSAKIEIIHDKVDAASILLVGDCTFNLPIEPAEHSVDLFTSTAAVPDKTVCSRP